MSERLFGTDVTAFRAGGQAEQDVGTVAEQVNNYRQWLDEGEKVSQ